MAEAIGLAASLLNLASFGISVVTTLNTFVTSFANAEKKINELSASVALTSSILDSLGNTIREHEEEFNFTVDNFIATRDACEKNFQTLGKALMAVKKKENEQSNGVNKATIGKKRKMGVWDKLMHALGGEDFLKGLVVSIETSKSNLQLLLMALNLRIFKTLNKKNLLTEEQAEDFKLFMKHLPTLVMGLQRAGIMATESKKQPPKKKKADSVLVAMTVDEDGKISESVKDEGVDSSEDCETRAELPKLQLKIPEVTTLTSDSRSELEGSSDPPIEPKAEVNFLSGDMTASRSAQQMPIQLNSIPTPLQMGQKGGPQGTDGTLPSNFPPPNTSLHLDTRSIYEGWIVEPKFRTPSLRAVPLFCGLKILRNDPAQHSNYRISPFSLDKEVLKNLVNEVSREEQASADASLLEDLPEEAQGKVKKLLRERNMRATSPYGWKIAAVEDKGKKGYRTFFSVVTRKSKGEKDTTPKWLIVLCGGVLSPGSKKASLGDLPDRLSNPWQERGASRGATGAVPWLDSDSSSDGEADISISRDRRLPRFGHGKKYTWKDGRRSLPPINFKDALGRQFTFPFYSCRTWDGMEELIRQAFFHIERLGPQVEQGRYDLIGRFGEIILPKVWEDTVEPGLNISMQLWPLTEPRAPGFPGPAPGHHFRDGHGRRGPPTPPSANWPGGQPPRHGGPAAIVRGQSRSRNRGKKWGSPISSLSLVDDSFSESTMSSVEVDVKAPKEKLLGKEEAEKLMNEFLASFGDETKDGEE